MGLHFNTEISITDVIGLFSFISIVIGGIFALVRWNTSIKVRRAEYIDKLYSKRANKRIRNVLYMFDYTDNWYKMLKEDAELEVRVDDTLSFYSYICYLKRQGLLDDKEFDFFKYDILMILSNKGVQEYFKDFTNHAHSCMIPSCYKDLIGYGKDMGLEEYVC